MNGFIVDNVAGIFPSEKSVLDIFRDRIKRALKNGHKMSFKVAVGFFFFDGFRKLYPDLKKLYEKGLLKEFKLIMGPETKKSTKEILQAIKTDALALNDEVFSFIKKLYKEGKFDFRVFLDHRSFHVKLYIFERNDVIDEVWAGSANFTEGGLLENIELIVPTGAKIEEKELYLKFFEEMWKLSTDEVEKLKVIDIIREGVKTDFIYLEPRVFFANILKLLNKTKLLETPELENEYLAKFQIMSIDLVEERLDKYGGCILSNSVGLGKTDVACVIAKKYSQEGKNVLIIVPPVLKNHWKSTLEKVGASLEKIKILSMGMLQKHDFDWKKYENFDLIIVDEAHHYRVTKPKSNRRKNLENICKLNKNASILLVTATPINISLFDLTSLIRLFKRGKYSRILEETGLWKKVLLVENYSRKGEDIKAVPILEDLLESFVVRIDWIDIVENFKEDLIKIAGIETVEMPIVEKIEYSYEKIIVKEIFDKIVNFLKGLNYEYAKLWKEEYPKEEEAKYLVWWYKWRLYKRLESSIFAFEKSLERMKKRNEYLLNLFLKKRRKKTNLFSKDRIEVMKKTFNSLDKKTQEKIIENIKKDIAAITQMLARLKKVKEKIRRDQKIEKLIEILKKENRPTIIFSESRDTVIYIANYLRKVGFNKFVVAYGGSGTEDYEDEYEKIKEINKEKIQKEFNEGKYDILISTDVLSEGVNLPRADVVINFDLPYNPVKLIQRDGRAFRITNPKKIKIYNFAPAEEINKELELFEILEARVNLIISSIGIDFLIWSVREKKVKDLSEKSKKRFYKLLKEWKELLSTRNPEELKKITVTKIAKEDYVFRQFIDYYKISKETIEKYYRKYPKPIYTVLKGEKEGLWVAYETGSGFIDFVGEIEFSSQERKAKITKSDREKINSLVSEKEKEKALEILKTPVSKEKIVREIFKLMEENLPGLLNEFDPDILPKEEKKKLLELLKKFKKSAPWKQDKVKEKIKNLISKYGQTKNIEIKILKEPKILAVIKYVPN